MKNLELYSITKGVRDDVTGFWISLYDTDTCQSLNFFLGYFTSKAQCISHLRSRGVVCPHRAYRN